MILVETAFMEDGSIIEAPGTIPGTAMTRVYPDGLVAGVISRLFAAADIFISRHDWESIDESWTYLLFADAVAAFLSWDPRKGEPEGWIEHKPSHRRREGGDPNLETVRP